MTVERRPLGFFLNGAVALILLFAATFLMPPAGPVYAVRGMIVVGLALIALKLVLRRRGIEFPPRRGSPRHGANPTDRSGAPPNRPS